MEEDEQEQRRRKVEAGRAKVASSSPLLPWREILWGFRCSHCRLTEAVVAERWKLPSARPSRRFSGIHFLAAAILNPPPSALPRPAAAPANRRLRRTCLVGGPSAVGVS